MMARKSKEAATAAAQRMVHALGDKWEVWVWENSGWQSCARLKPRHNIQIFDHSDHPNYLFTCFFNSAHQYLGRGVTPQEALDDSVAKVKKAFAVTLSDLESVL